MIAAIYVETTVEVAEAVVDTWPPTKIRVFVPEGTERADLDEIAQVLNHYDPSFVHYRADQHNQPLSGVWITLADVPVALKRAL